MVPLTERLELVGEKARKTLAAKDAAREKSLQLSRETVRYSTNAIRAVHRGEYEDAKNLLASARLLLKDLDKALSNHQELFDAGYVYNAQKEYVEGCITHALIAGGDLPDADELGVSYASYLNGMGKQWESYAAISSTAPGGGRYPAARSCFQSWMMFMG